MQQPGEWFDIVVALIQYLQSGESRVGFLNKNAGRNMLHREIEIQRDTDEESYSNTEKSPSENTRPGFIASEEY